MVTIIRVDNLIKVADSVKPDTKRRVCIPKTLFKEGLSYHIYVNDIGQIVLDPQITIPASEAWLFINKKTLASVDKGINESTNGQRTDRGSFAKYTKDEL
jgi:hypothetical protein